MNAFVQNGAVKSNHLLDVLAFAIAALCLLQPLSSPAAETAKDPQALMNNMRLKKWTKDLQLTEAQQKKVQVILDEEGRQISRLDQETSLDLNQRRAKVDDLRHATYAKIKPLLDATQLAAFEKSLAKSAPKKK
jgi:hypothetical protein